MTKVKMVKHDALININIGTGFLQQLQQMLIYIAANVTPEQLETYKTLVQNKEEYTEEWMQHLTTISILIKEIEQRAEEQGFIYEGELPDDVMPQDN